MKKNTKKIIVKKTAEGLTIVGIGASAGGLEAIEELLNNLPSDSDSGFVIVIHMDPHHKGMMPEILQRITSMKVNEAEDGQHVLPNNIYIIPANKEMAILNGNIQLLDIRTGVSPRMSIDFFFRNLAQDQGDRAVCIILSGMGTDGTLGLKAIKERLGVVMVQDPLTAKFDSMPQSAIDTGLADIVAAPKELAAKLYQYLKGRVQGKMTDLLPAEGAGNTLRKIFVILRGHTGHDFALYKRSTVSRRIEKRMMINHIDSLKRYINYLQRSPGEIDTLFKDLLIGVTNFFRDPEAFQTIENKYLQGILESKPENSVIRVWVVGCSTGEEAYSIAILLHEALEKANRAPSVKVQIFATDIDTDSINRAREGLYPENIFRDISAQRLQRYFDKKDKGYQIKKEIREMVVFAIQNVAADPPFTKLDLITCRNLLIYFSPELQKGVIPTFHYALNPSGILFLGSAESLGSFSDYFSTLDNRWKIFRRKEARRSALKSYTLRVPSEGRRNEKSAGKELSRSFNEASFTETAQKILMTQFTPASVIINKQGDILFVAGKTGKYLEPSPGQARMNVFEMSKEGIKYELSSLILKAIADGKEIKREHVRFKTNSGIQSVNITVRPLTEPESMNGLLVVVFEDNVQTADTGPAAGKRKTDSKRGEPPARLKKELREAKEQLQRTIEGMQSSLEEVKSTNEELQSTNEELQSTNEELMTSKEEMQSMNEELITVNAEHQGKIEEIGNSNNDMKNLLDNVDLGVIFLDNLLRIKRFTVPVTKIMNIMQTDIGRPVADIMIQIPYPDMLKDCREVIDKLVPKVKTIQTKEGAWYLVKIMPYKTLENFIEGIVITFADISVVKNLQTQLTAQEYSQSVLDTVREPMIVLNSGLHVVSANNAFYKLFFLTDTEIIGRNFFELGDGQWEIPHLRKLIENILPRNNEFNDFVVEHDFALIGPKKLLLNGRRIAKTDGKAELVLIAIEDVTGK